MLLLLFCTVNTCYVVGMPNKIILFYYSILFYSTNQCFSQVLASELENLKLQKQSLEVHLSELQHLRESDLHQYQQQLSALEQQLTQALEERNEARELGEHNQSLSLELEKEKGRLAGKN